MAVTELVVADVELRHGRRAGPTVQVGDAEPVAVAPPAGAEETELARVEDRLVAHGRDPALGADANAQALGDPPKSSHVLCDRPIVAVARDEQARERRPCPRAGADRPTPDRPPSRRRQPPHGPSTSA